MRRRWPGWLKWSGPGLVGLSLLAVLTVPLPAGPVEPTSPLPTPLSTLAAAGAGDAPDLGRAESSTEAPNSTAPGPIATSPVPTDVLAATGPPTAEVAQTLAAPAPTSTPSPTATATPVPPTPTAEPARPAPRRIGGAPPPEVTADYVAILDEASGQLLYGQDERVRAAPASVTKIITALVALEREPNLARRIEVTISGSAMNRRDGSSIMGLEPGRTVSLETLLYGLMLPSGNDAAEQLALELAGSRQSYVDWMNQKAAELNLRDTHFVNPSGMDAAAHYSSAYDLARLGRAAMRNETFRRLAGALTYEGDGYELKNLNRLLGAYPGADGIKIGLTPRAGRTIVASATHDGHRVYVSLLRSENLPADSAALFDWVWETFDW